MIETFAALAGRNYRFYWIGLVFYVLGHRAEYVTFAWLTWEVDHDPLSLGYLGLAQGVPLVLFQLFGGVLADRTNRLRLLLGTQILTALALTIAFVLTALGLARVQHLLVLAVLSNTFRAFDEPSRLALIPAARRSRATPERHRARLHPLAGGPDDRPSIAGILIAAFGGAVGFGMAAGASYVALALYSRLRVASHGRPATAARAPAVRRGAGFVGHNFVFAEPHRAGAVQQPLRAVLRHAAADLRRLVLRRRLDRLRLAERRARVGALGGTLDDRDARPAHRAPGHRALRGRHRPRLLRWCSRRRPRWGGPAGARARRLQQHLLSHAGQHVIQQRVPDHLRGRVFSLYALCWNSCRSAACSRARSAAAVDARFAILFGGGVVAANAAAPAHLRRLRAIGRRPGLSAAI